MFNVIFVLRWTFLELTGDSKFDGRRVKRIESGNSGDGVLSNIFGAHVPLPLEYSRSFWSRFSALV